MRYQSFIASVKLYNKPLQQSFTFTRVSMGQLGRVSKPRPDVTEPVSGPSCGFSLLTFPGACSSQIERQVLKRQASLHKSCASAHREVSQSIHLSKRVTWSSPASRVEQHLLPTVRPQHGCRCSILCRVKGWDQ